MLMSTVMACSSKAPSKNHMSNCQAGLLGENPNPMFRMGHGGITLDVFSLMTALLLKIVLTARMPINHADCWVQSFAWCRLLSYIRSLVRLSHLLLTTVMNQQMSSYGIFAPSTLSLLMALENQMVGDVSIATTIILLLRISLIV